MNALHVRLSHSIFIPVILLVFIASTGCTPTPTPVGDCLLEDLTAPENLSPNYSAGGIGTLPIVDSLTPTFTWDALSDCTPDGFTIELFQPHPDAAESARSVPLVAGTSWTADTPLLPGAMYAWRVSAVSGSSPGPASDTAYFLTGPLCMDPFASEYPAPVLLAPEDGALITSGSEITFADGTTMPTVTFHMIWNDPAECVPVDGYNIQVSDSVTFPNDSAHTWMYTQDDETVVLFFFPPGAAWSQCQPYYWRVQADLPGGEEGPFSDSRSFTINTQGLDCSLGPVPVSTPEPSSVLDATPTSVMPYVFLTIPAYCRSGPTLDHPILDTLPKGMLMPIQGQNQQQTWWWVYDERIPGNCWVSNKVVEVRGGTGNLPIITPVAAPAPYVTDTPTVGCLTYDNNQALVCMAPCPPFAYPGTPCIVP